MNKSIVSTGSKESTDAAIDILKLGGNAIDAAVAAVFTSMTSEYALTGIGGGGAIMVKMKHSEPIVYDCFVDRPSIKSKKQIEFYKTIIDFGDSSQSFYIGKGSIGVPGNLAGLVKIQNDFGELPLSVVLEPAIYLARNGYRLTKEQSFIFQILKPIFSSSPEAKNLLYKNNQPFKKGDLFKNIDFSNFLERVVSEGIDFFYRGEVARKIHELLLDGGLVNIDSLKNYKVIKRTPLVYNFNGYDVYSNPLPSEGGSLIIFLLKLLENNKISIMRLIKAMSITENARQELIYMTKKNKSFNIFSKKQFNTYVEMFNSNNICSEDRKDLNNRGCTTQVSIIDKNQNCASITTSNGSGSGYIIPGTGVMLNNMLGEEDLNPYGFHSWNKSGRLSTMMSPSIIMLDGKPVMVLGSGGSNRIRSAIVQVLINYFNYKMDLKQAINSHRFHIEGKKIFYEPDVEIPKIKSKSNFSYIPFSSRNLFFGGVNAVTTTEGYSDPRRGGVSEILD